MINYLKQNKNAQVSFPAKTDVLLDLPRFLLGLH